MLEYTESGDAIMFRVHVVARASRSCVVGEHDGALKVRVAAPPVEGAANEELVRLLARALKVPARDVEITGGRTSKLKTVRISGATREQVSRLAAGEEA